MRRIGSTIGLTTAIVCAAGCQTRQVPCQLNRDCDEGELCTDGICRRTCNSNSVCARTETCQAGVCQFATDAGERDSGLDAAPADHVRIPDASRDRELVDANGRDRAAVDVGQPDQLDLDRAVADTSTLDRPAVDVSAGDQASGADATRIGSSSDNPGASCSAIKGGGDSIGDGVYWIKLTNYAAAFEIYCDMTTDGGGWILAFKLRNDDGDASPNYYLLVAGGSGRNFPLDLSGDFAASNWIEGASLSERWALWSEIGASEYRGTTLDSSSGRLLDVKKSDNRDSRNMFYCAATGCGNSPSSGYSNSWVGMATILVSNTAVGAALTAGQEYQQYQYGDFGCNCWESTHIGGNSSAGAMLFGDNNRNGMYVGPYTAFWIR